MTGTFEYQGFGVLSEWNGQVKSPSAQQAMLAMAATGANSIEITPRIWTQTTTSNEVISDPAKTESDASLIQGIENAHTDGLKVILKPNLSTLDHHIAGQLTPTDVAAFFASYKAEVVHLAEIAQQTGTEVLAIGNEMSSLSGAQYRDYWTDIINSVRAVYHGELTYAAATDEAHNVGFWDELDTIGVNTYPPLSVPQNATVTDLVNAWNQVPTNPYWAKAFENLSPVDFLHALSEQYGKQVLMTEAGYRSIDYGNTITGSWTTTGDVSLQEQANAYAAFLDVWSHDGGSWLQGVEFWQWDLSGQFSPSGFSPMDKPAEAIVTQYFKGVGEIAATNIEKLTADQIATLSAHGITTVVSSDHTANVSKALAAELAAAHISLSEAYGHGAQTLTWNADGTLHDIHYQVANGANVNDYDVVYNAVNKPVSASYADGSITSWDYNADGSLHEIVQNNIVGKDYTTTDTVYGTNGKIASESWQHGADLLKNETWNADGSVHDVHYFGVTGHAYTDYDVFYGANGKETLATYSNGMTEDWNYNADNSLHSITYGGVTDANYTSYTAGYGDNRQGVVQQFVDATGTETVRGLADHMTFATGADGTTATAPGGQSFHFAPSNSTVLTGGGGDTFVFQAGFGRATVTNFVPESVSAGSHDQLQFAKDMFADAADVLQHATQSGANTVIADAHGDSVTLQHVTVAQLTPSDFHLV